MIKRGIESLQKGTEASTWPHMPPRLSVRHSPNTYTADHTNRKTTGCTTETSTSGHTTSTITDNDDIVVTVNNTRYQASNAVSRSLLDWLRFEAGLTGTKEGCAEGECGACTVHFDGQAVLACLIPAARANGAQVTTIEDIASTGGLHPVQQALAETGGVQCGFCTPGFIMSATMLVKENPNPTKDQIEQALSGNLCRCTGYYPITEAIQSLTDGNQQPREVRYTGKSAEIAVQSPTDRSHSTKKTGTRASAHHEC